MITCPISWLRGDFLPTNSQRNPIFDLLAIKFQYCFKGHKTQSRKLSYETGITFFLIHSSHPQIFFAVDLARETNNRKQCANYKRHNYTSACLFFSSTPATCQTRKLITKLPPIINMNISFSQKHYLVESVLMTG